MTVFTCGQTAANPGTTYWCLSATIATSYNLALADLRAAYGNGLIAIEYGGLSQPSFFQLASPAQPSAWPGSTNIGSGAWILGMCETPPCSTACVLLNTLVNSEPTVPIGAQVPYISTDGFCGRAGLPAALDLCSGLNGLSHETGAPDDALFVYIDPDDNTCHVAPLDLSLVVSAQNGLNASVTPGVPELGGGLLHSTTVTLHDWPLSWNSGDGNDTCSMVQATAAWDVSSFALLPNEDTKFSLSPQLVTARYRNTTLSVLSGLSANSIICDLYHSQVGNHTAELSMTAVSTFLKFANATNGNESSLTLDQAKARLHWNATFSPGTLSTYVECRSDVIEFFGYAASTLMFSAYPNTRNDGGSIVNILTTATDGTLQSHPIGSLSVSPSGAVGGDLSGTLPNPTVAKVNTRPFSLGASPVTGQFIRWDGTNYVNQTYSPSIPVVLDDLSDVVITSPASGQTIIHNGSNFVNRLPIDPIAGFVNGKPSASLIVLRYIAGRAFTLPTNLSGSYFKAGTAATASSVFDIQKNGTSIGSLTFAASGTVATFTVTSTSFAAGDTLLVVSPASADATLADLGLTLMPS